MALLKPIANKVTTFDATSEHKFEFNVNGGDQVVANMITIVNQNNNNIVYQNKITTYNFYQIVPSGVLQNQTYYACYFNTFDVKNNMSDDSNLVQFYCVSEPNLKFINLPYDTVIDKNFYEFKIQYRHEVFSETLDSIKYCLYDNFENIVSESEIYITDKTIPITISHTFNGFENYAVYKIKAIAKTSSGLICETPLVTFNVRYEHITEDYKLLEIKNDCTENSVKVSSNVIVSEGHINPIDEPIKYDINLGALDPNIYIHWNEDYTLLEPNEVISEWTELFLDIREGENYVAFDEGVSLSSNFTITTTLKDGNLGKLMQLGTEENGYVINYVRGVPIGMKKPMDYLELLGYVDGELVVRKKSNYVDLLNQKSYYFVWFRKHEDDYELKLEVISSGEDHIEWEEQTYDRYDDNKETKIIQLERFTHTDRTNSTQSIDYARMTLKDYFTHKYDGSNELINMPINFSTYKLKELKYEDGKICFELPIDANGNIQLYPLGLETQISFNSEMESKKRIKEMLQHTALIYQTRYGNYNGYNSQGISGMWSEHFEFEEFDNNYESVEYNWEKDVLDNSQREIINFLDKDNFNLLDVQLVDEEDKVIVTLFVSNRNYLILPYLSISNETNFGRLYFINDTEEQAKSSVMFTIKNASDYPNETPTQEFSPRFGASPISNRFEDGYVYTFENRKGDDIEIYLNNGYITIPKGSSINFYGGTNLPPNWNQIPNLTQPYYGQSIRSIKNKNVEPIAPNSYRDYEWAVTKLEPFSTSKPNPNNPSEQLPMFGSYMDMSLVYEYPNKSSFPLYVDRNDVNKYYYIDKSTDKVYKYKKYSTQDMFNPIAYDYFEITYDDMYTELRKASPSAYLIDVKYGDWEMFTTSELYDYIGNEPLSYIANYNDGTKEEIKFENLKELKYLFDEDTSSDIVDEIMNKGINLEFLYEQDMNHHTTIISLDDYLDMESNIRFNSYPNGNNHYLETNKIKLYYADIKTNRYDKFGNIIKTDYFNKQSVDKDSFSQCFLINIPYEILSDYNSKNYTDFITKVYPKNKHLWLMCKTKGFKLGYDLQQIGNNNEVRLEYLQPNSLFERYANINEYVLNCKKLENTSVLFRAPILKVENKMDVIDDSIFNYRALGKSYITISMDNIPNGFDINNFNKLLVHTDGNYLSGSEVTQPPISNIGESIDYMRVYEMCVMDEYTLIDTKNNTISFILNTREFEKNFGAFFRVHYYSGDFEVGDTLSFLSNIETSLISALENRISDAKEYEEISKKYPSEFEYEKTTDLTWDGEDICNVSFSSYIQFDNSKSKLNATNVQDALGELTKDNHKYPTLPKFVELNGDMSGVFPIGNITLGSGQYNYLDVSKNTNFEYSLEKRNWDYDTRLHCLFNDNLYGGNLQVGFSNLKALLIKRRKQNTFDWITIKEQKVENMNDLIILFDDYFIPTHYDATYALVPLLADNSEMEYIMTDISTQFNGFTIADGNNAFNLRAEIKYGGDIRNSTVGTYLPLSGKYPILQKNSDLDYVSGSFTAKILGYNFDNNVAKTLDRFDIAKQTEDLCAFLNDMNAKIIKDWNGNIHLVRFTGSPNITYDSAYGNGITEVTANWVEQGKFDNQEDLYRTGLVKRY